MGIDYLRSATAPANQQEQARHDQVPNSADGYVFKLDDWARLRRFLILGSEGGTYYTGERKLTCDNAGVVQRLALTDGLRLVAEIVDVSESGRAPKNDPAILALAIAAKCDDPATRQSALSAVPRVCRIGTHLYHFAEFINQLGGWGRGTRRAVAGWFNGRAPSDLAHQLVKYQSRDGWSSRDLLRLSHAKPATPEHDALFRWVCASETDRGRYKIARGDLHPIIAAFEELSSADVSEGRAVELIRDHRLPREAVATRLLTAPQVWEALLPHMGLTALVRNLATMTKIGLLAPFSGVLLHVCHRISDAVSLSKARVHPIHLLSALKTYAQGHGERGTSTWTPVQAVVDALDAGFYTAFRTVEPTGKATLLALDVSGSMEGGKIAGCPGLTPRLASAAMALVTAAREPRHAIMGFSHRLVDVPISPGMRLDQAASVIDGIPMGRTDCSLPMVWAAGQRSGVEAFSVYTDNETYHGNVHPFRALSDYRKSSGLAARLAVVGMTATEFSIADPSDAGMLDFVGFDAAAPALMADFFRGA